MKSARFRDLIPQTTTATESLRRVLIYLIRWSA
jgi:hypothetical protein